MKNIIYFFALSVALLSCASHKKAVQGNTTATTVVADGSSFDKAVFITEIHESPGVGAEYQWIRAKYPGYRTRGQSLVYHNNKPFDVIHITTADGTDKDVYFDISNFYGKF